MKLYEKHISANGKVTYKEHKSNSRVDIEIDDLQVNTLVSTIAICWLKAMATQLGTIKKGSALARGIDSVEGAIGKLAALAAGKMDDKMVDAGTVAWGKALETLQVELSKG